MHGPFDRGHFSMTGAVSQTVLLRFRGTIPFMDDTISIRCKRCRATFRDRARRVQPGYSRQCPSCQALLLFEEHISDPTIQSALRDARKLRRALREAEDAKAGG